LATFHLRHNCCSPAAHANSGGCGVILFPVEICLGGGASRRPIDLGQGHRPGEALSTTILFIPLSAAQYNLETDWAEAGAEVILRRCPICFEDSIVGHGRRRKQAHDEHHDWIGIRRGRCNRCHKTFTFLPPFSPPYSHYSFIARSQALQRRFIEGHSWEAAAPAVKDPNRVADPSTLRRWFHSLDSSQPPFSYLRQTMRTMSVWLGKAEILVHNSMPLRWPSAFAFLARFWPLRI
jgi:hypothetical protein